MSLFEYENIPCPDGEGDEFPPEENATLGRLVISACDHLLTKGRDVYTEKEEQGPLVSQYYVAQWLVWNYWRLRWEGRTAASDWGSAHRMVTIGGGYSWPDITIVSNGEQLIFNSDASPEGDRTAFEYLGSKIPSFIAPTFFDESIEKYVNQVLTDLAKNKLSETDLHDLWELLREERADSATAEMRRFEALLGCDPDEGDERKIKDLIEFAKKYDERDVREIAAEYGATGQFFGVHDLEEIARNKGMESKIADLVSLTEDSRNMIPSIGSCAPWKVGEAAAKALRIQEKLSYKPMDDHYLAKLAAISDKALECRDKGVEQKFAFKFENKEKANFVLSNGVHTTRRFELARLLGDRLIYGHSALFSFAGRASKAYRQKAQRAFAAEFLAPLEAVKERLQGDYSYEATDEIAPYFMVSPMNIRHALRNHGLIEDEYDESRDAA